MTPPPKFDLTTEPWVPVTWLDGRPDELSLRDVLLRAHELRWLDAEAPPVTAALHRLLITVLHHALDGPVTWRDWAELWRETTLPSTKIEQYFDKRTQQFDLFDVKRPFLQCPALSDLTMKTPAKLVHFRASGNNRTLFDHTTAADRLILSPMEAARWLVTVHAYDPGGTKTPYKKIKNSSRAPCNEFGTVLVEGNTLKETLLLNTCEYDPASDKPWSSAYPDRPAWDAEPPEPTPERRAPYGWLDLLTWPTRRVLLHPTTGNDGTNVVDGALITPGVTLMESLYRAELMAAFESTKTRDKDLRWNPVQLHELQGIWRHARDMLLVEDPQRAHGRPRVLDHVAEQIGWETLSPHTVFTIRVFGQQLGNMSGSVHAWLHEQLPAPAALLNARLPWIGEVIGSCVGLADRLGAALTNLTKECRAAFDAEPSAQVKRNAPLNVGLTQDYWPRLPAPFSELLLHLGDAVENKASAAPSVQEWKTTVHSAATASADRLLTQLRERQSRHLYAFAGAHTRFTSTVAKHCRTFDGQIKRHLP